MTNGFRTIRVLSYNIHKGFSGIHGRYVLERVRQELHALNPDVVFLQEVLGGHRRHLREGSQYELLAAGEFPHVIYGKNREYRQGHHGNALLSKIPIEWWSNTDISSHRFEGRGALHAVLRLADGVRLHCVCLHLALFRIGRTVQLDRVGRIIEERIPADEPLVVAGDFNDWTKRASRHIVHRFGAEELFKGLHGNYARTFPSWFPMLCLDRIYGRGVTAHGAHAVRLRGLSDHSAVIVEIGIPRNDIATEEQPLSAKKTSEG